MDLSICVGDIFDVEPEWHPPVPRTVIAIYGDDVHYSFVRHGTESDRAQRPLRSIQRYLVEGRWIRRYPRELVYPYGI